MIKSGLGKHLPSRRASESHSTLTETENDRGRSGRGGTRPPRSLNSKQAMYALHRRGSKSVAQRRERDLAGRITRPSRIRRNRPTADRGRSIRQSIRVSITTTLDSCLSPTAWARNTGSPDGGPCRNPGIGETCKAQGVVR